MKKRIVIVGAGPGGYTAAVRAAQQGADVTLIEREHVGGTCLNRGCIPSKIMKTTAEMRDRLGHATEFGLCLEGRPAVDMGALMSRKEKVIQVQRQGIQGLLAHHAIRLIHGTAHVTGKGEVTVACADGSKDTLAYDNLILAMGTSPLSIPALPFDGTTLLSSDDVLNLTEVPASLMIVGGGVIGCEFACILSALGAKVTLVEARERLLPLPSVDESCSKLLLREMKKRKIKVLLEQVVQKTDKNDGMLSVSVGPSPQATRPSKETTIEVDKMAICIGRASNARDLGLEAIGVTLDSRGWIQVDDTLETSAPGIYAIGDITGPERVMLAHVASTEAGMAVDNIFGARQHMDYGGVPGGIFTMPEIGNVGLTEAQARERGFNVRADTVLFRTLGKAQVMGELAGEAKLVSDRDTGRILGVHITGPHATDLVAEGVLAIQQKATVRDLARTIHAHPTLSEIMLEAAFKADDRSLHG